MGPRPQYPDFINIPFRPVYLLSYNANRVFSSLEVSWTGRFYDDSGDSYDDPALIDYPWDPTFRAQNLATSIEETNKVLAFRTVRSQLSRRPWDCKSSRGSGRMSR